MKTSDSWTRSLQGSFTNPKELLEYLQLEIPDDLLSTQTSFPFLVPRFFASLMQKGCWDDPLLRQVLPLEQEERKSVAALLDPLEEQEAFVDKAIMQKFQTRVLLMTSGHCAVNCRYCFRRNFPYKQYVSPLKDLQKQLLALSGNQKIMEIIFSGGDPLTLPNRSLEKLIKTAESLEAVKVLRFHTRLPVVIPGRVEEELCEIFKKSTKKIVMVLHINHAQEISQALKQKVRLIEHYNIPVYNQAVLLKGVNDSVEAQKALWEKGYLSSIFPYYLHQLDPVQGASHFKVDLNKGQSLMKSLRAQLPGYMIPRYVAEIPGAPNKVPLD